MTSSCQDDVVMPDADAANNASGGDSTEETHRPMEVEACSGAGESPNQSDSHIGKRRRADFVAPADADAADDASRVTAVRTSILAGEEKAEEAGGQEGPGPKRVCRRPADRASTDVAAAAAFANSSDARALLPQEPDAFVEAKAAVPQLEAPKQPPSRIQQCRDSDRTKRMPRLITPSPSHVSVVCPVPGSASERDGVKSKTSTIIRMSKSEHPAGQNSAPEQPSPEISATGTEPSTRKRRAEGDQSPTRRTWRSFVLPRRLLLLFLVVGLAPFLAVRFLGPPSDPAALARPPPLEPGSVYVPGAGFSGFWFTLGRLRSVPDPASRSYYCYSAGCLGVVATLSGRSRDEMLGLALEAQRLWQVGEIGRYDVVPRFVDGLLSLDYDDGYGLGKEDGEGVGGASTATTQNLRIMTDAHLLSKIKVITTRKKKGSVIMHHVIRTPKTIYELREMLVHTTWIPYVTGGSLWAEDSRTGDRHMDGGASFLGHPTCAHHLSLPFVVDLFVNTLNVNLGRDKVEKFWDAGVAFGSEIGKLEAVHGQQ